MKERHRKCEQCNYTHGAAIGCCPTELRRTTPKSSAGSNAISLKRYQDAAEQETPKDGAHRRPGHRRPAVSTQSHTPQQPAQAVPDRKPDSGLLKDVWFFDSPLPPELTNARATATPDRRDGQLILTQQ